MRSLSAVIMATFILNVVPVLAQENHEEKLVKIPVIVSTTFGGKPVMSFACLGIKERRYDGNWENFIKTAQTAPEKALISTIHAMQAKDLEALKAVSHTDFLANPKQFDEQAKAFFSQFQIFELDGVNASFSYDDMVVFLIKIKYKGRADFIRFVLRHDAVQNKYGFLTGFSNKDPNDLPGIIARDWFVSPWGPAKTTAFLYCEGHEFTHRFLL